MKRIINSDAKVVLSKDINIPEENAEDLKDSKLYAYLIKNDPLGKKMVSKAEQDEFENG